MSSTRFTAAEFERRINTLRNLIAVDNGVAYPNEAWLLSELELAGAVILEMVKARRIGGLKEIGQAMERAEKWVNEHWVEVKES